MGKASEAAARDERLACTLLTDPPWEAFLALTRQCVNAIEGPKEEEVLLVAEEAEPPQQEFRHADAEAARLYAEMAPEGKLDFGRFGE